MSLPDFYFVAVMLALSYVIIGLFVALYKECEGGPISYISILKCVVAWPMLALQ